MQDNAKSFRMALKALAAEARSSEGSHPAMEVLVACSEGRLSEQEEEGVRAHMAICEHCTELFLDLDRFPNLEPPSEEYRISEDQKAQDLSALNARLGIRRSSASGRPARSWSMGLAMAATVLAAVNVALLFWGSAAHRKADELSRRLARRTPEPLLLSAIQDLHPVEAGAERDTQGDLLFRTDAAGPVLLNLTVMSTRSFSTYRVEIARRDGATLWTHEANRLSQYGHLATVIPKELAGDLEIRLYGLGGEAPEPLATYFLTIERGP